MFWLLIGYMFLYIHRPFEVWPILGDMRIELLYMIVAGGVWLVTPNKKLVPNGMHLAVASFAVAVIICTCASTVSDRCLEATSPFLKFLVFYGMLVTTVHDEKSLKLLVLAFVGVVGIYMLHSFWEYLCGRHVFRMGISRMIGVDLTRNDPNAFAATLLLAMVFVPALWRSFEDRRIRRFLAGFCAMAMLCIALTGSRSGFVGLVIWWSVIIWQSPWRKTLAMLAVPAAPFLFLLLPAELQTRFETIINPDAGPSNAKTSGEARIIGLTLGFELWQANPVAGIGPGAWRPITHRALESHNMYGQLMGEMGALGVLTFGSILTCFGCCIYRIRRAYRDHPEWNRDFLYHLSAAVGFGLFMLLFEGNFGHNLFRYNWFMYGAFISIGSACVSQREREPVYEVWDDEPAVAGLEEEHLGYGGLYS